MDIVALPKLTSSHEANAILPDFAGFKRITIHTANGINSNNAWEKVNQVILKAEEQLRAHREDFHKRSFLVVNIYGVRRRTDGTLQKRPVVYLYIPEECPRLELREPSGKER